MSRRSIYDLCVVPQCGKATVGYRERCEPCRDARIKQANHDWQVKHRDTRSTTKRTVKAQRNEKSLLEACAVIREPQTTFSIGQLQHARVGGQFEAMLNKILGAQ